MLHDFLLLGFPSSAERAINISDVRNRICSLNFETRKKKVTSCNTSTSVFPVIVELEN